MLSEEVKKPLKDLYYATRNENFKHPADILCDKCLGCISIKAIQNHIEAQAQEIERLHKLRRLAVDMHTETKAENKRLREVLKTYAKCEKDYILEEWHESNDINASFDIGLGAREALKETP